MFLKSIKIIITFCSFFILVIALPVSASSLNFKPQVGIGGDFTKDANVAVINSTQTIGEYIKQIYKYAIGIVGIVAVVVMMIGGVLWMTAGGNPSQVGSAQQYITGALTGLVLVMFSYVILKTVNPDLVSFKVHEIKKVEIAVANFDYGCCAVLASGEETCSMTYISECSSGNFYGAGYVCNSTTKKCETTNNKCNMLGGACTEFCPEGSKEVDEFNSYCSPHKCCKRTIDPNIPKCGDAYEGGRCHAEAANTANSASLSQRACEETFSLTYESNGICLGNLENGTIEICCRKATAGGRCGENQSGTCQPPSDTCGAFTNHVSGGADCIDNYWCCK